MNKILNEDLAYIFDNLTGSEKVKLKNATILLTGCAGFIGFYLMSFFHRYLDELGISLVIALDNFILGKPKWLEDLTDKESKKIRIHTFDIAKDDIAEIEDSANADFVIHMASIASPTFYRRYPIETLDANVWGLRRLLDFYPDRDIKGLLFFSSSEVYGDPLPESVPTAEDYRGNVSAIGPRACYDEAKRFGETLCYLYSTQYNMPVTIVRPFNNFGPGMKFDDRRVPADFAKAVFENRDIIIHSDGTPKRTFCYAADAVTGYLKALLFGRFEYFNIGIDRPEISIKELSDIYAEKAREILGYRGAVRFIPSQEPHYLTDNPSRRCPNIDKAKRLLNYNPTIEVREGVGRFLEYLKIEKGRL